MGKIESRAHFAADEAMMDGSSDASLRARSDDEADAKIGSKAEAPEAPIKPDQSAKAPVAPSQPPDAEMEAPVGAERKRRRIRIALFALLPLVLMLGGYFYVTGGATMETDNAYVRADTVSVSTDVVGTVESIAVHDNERVKKGQVLYQLDPLPFKLALEKANGMVGIAKSQLTAQKTAYSDLQAQIRQQQMDITYYERAFARKQSLVKDKYASRAAFDLAQHNLQDAEQKLASLKAQLDGAAAKLDGHPDWPVTKLSGYLYAVAQRDEAARQLRHTTVRAPFGGIVTNVPSLQVGQQLAAGTPAFSLVATDHVWVEANPKETQLTYVKPGQPVTVSVDTYPDFTWHGTVDSISPASASSFAMLPAQNTSGNWVKVVQRIPLRVRIDTPADKPILRAGMSVEIDVDTGHPRGLPQFVRSWFGWLTGDTAKTQASGVSHG